MEKNKKLLRRDSQAEQRKSVEGNFYACPDQTAGLIAAPIMTSQCTK